MLGKIAATGGALYGHYLHLSRQIYEYMHYKHYNTAQTSNVALGGWRNSR
jgi:hypothetical protein